VQVSFLSKRYSDFVIESYGGRQVSENMSDIYIVRLIYQNNDSITKSEYLLDKNDTCTYQICVNNDNCEDITLKVQHKILLADVIINGSPAVLSFQKNADDSWIAVSAAQQNNGLWGRDLPLKYGDVIIPNTIHIDSSLIKKNSEIQIKSGNELNVENPEDVTLKTNCNMSDATIWVSYYGINNNPQFDQICIGEDCENVSVSLKE